MSRKALVSLPSRKATSGLISSPTSSAEAFWRSAASTSPTGWRWRCRALAPVCSFRGDLLGQFEHGGVVVVDGGDVLAERDQVFPDRSPFRHSCRSAPQRWLSASSCGRTLSGEAGTPTRRLRRHFQLRVSSSLPKVSRGLPQLGKAAGLPCRASDEALARRWESMRISPEAAT